MIAVMAAAGVLLASPAAAQSRSGRSPTCGPITGQTAADLQRVERFCAERITSAMRVETAFAMRTSLWIQVARTIADVMLANSLTTEGVVKEWMEAWRRITGAPAVRVHVRWQDTVIATGTTSAIRGDVVTLRPR